MVTLPDRDWFFIAEVAAMWNKSVSYVEHFLLNGKLDAALNLPFMMLRKCKVECDGQDIWHEGYGDKAICGLFNIDSYSFLKWNKSESGTKFTDLCSRHIYISDIGCIGFNQCNGHAECEYRYCFKKSYIIEINDIVITLNEINRFKAEFGTLEEHIQEELMQEDTVNIASDAVTKNNTIALLEPETETYLCEQLRLQKLPDKEIARELKKKFPALFPSRIGKLVT